VGKIKNIVYRKILKLKYLWARF